MRNFDKIELSRFNIFEFRPNLHLADNIMKIDFTTSIKGEIDR